MILLRVLLGAILWATLFPRPISGGNLPFSWDIWFDSRPSTDGGIR